MELQAITNRFVNACYWAGVSANKAGIRLTTEVVRRCRIALKCLRNARIELAARIMAACPETKIIWTEAFK
jgi:hypothetical protein